MHVSYFEDNSLLNIPTFLNNQVNKGTPLFLLIDSENIEYPHDLPRLILCVKEHFIDFDVQACVAMSQKRFDFLKKPVQKQLLDIPRLKLHRVPPKENSADHYLKEFAEEASRECPKAYFCFVTSDSDFSNLVVRLRYYYHHKVLLFHNISDEKNVRGKCMILAATHAIPLKLFWDKIRINQYKLFNVPNANNEQNKPSELNNYSADEPTRKAVNDLTSKNRQRSTKRSTKLDL